MWVSLSVCVCACVCICVCVCMWRVYVCVCVCETGCGKLTLEFKAETLVVNSWSKSEDVSTNVKQSVVSSLCY